MKKKEKTNYDKEYFNYNNLFSTKYDKLFRDVIKGRGVAYYTSHKVTKFQQSESKISAVIKGTIDYHVAVEYIDNEKIKVQCNCPYHKETDVYCKHVYALLLTLKMIYEKEKMINIYKINRKKISNIKDEIRLIVSKNKKYLDGLIFSWGNDLSNFYDKYLKEMSNKFDKDNDYKLIGLVHDSYYHLNNIIDDYNKLIDYVNEGKVAIENKEIDEISYTFTIDDSNIFDYLDETFANVDISILEKVRQENIKNNEDTEIIDKAIKERKRRDEEIIKEKKQEELEERKWRKRYRRATFFGLLSGIFDGFNNKSTSYGNPDYLMPWEKDLTNKGEYEYFNFEEDELEEDDFYYEDD